MTSTTAAVSATPMVAKPKERQFQVVPVPAVFTRGRWECIDYKDGAAPAPGASGAPQPQFSLGPIEQTIIELVDHHNNGKQSSQQQTPLATQQSLPPPGNGHGHQQHGQQGNGNETGSQVPQSTAGGCLPTNSSVPHFEISPSHSVPTTLGTEFVPPNISSGESTNGAGTSTHTQAPSNTPAPSCNSGSGGQNAVAIDNKIEQAMDLVKTHLTFAVREEVEILRTTITELETRVSLLESENQILRQFAPADVVANLTALAQAAVAQQQQANQQQQRAFQTVPSAPVIMDTSVVVLPPSSTTSTISQQKQAAVQSKQHSPTPGSGDEIL